MKFTAKRGDLLIVIDENWDQNQKALGQVYQGSNHKMLAPFNVHSILLRGDWERTA